MPSLQTYFPELYYFFDQKDFDRKKAILITAQHVAQYCHSFEAKILMTVDTNAQEKERAGALPANLQEKKDFVAELCEWIWKFSACEELFFLFFFQNTENRTQLRFDHHDDTCCWNLQLTPQEFAGLQESWRHAGLPEDIFFHEDKVITIDLPLGWFDRLLLKLGFSVEKKRQLTPRRSEHSVGLQKI